MSEALDSQLAAHAQKPAPTIPPLLRHMLVAMLDALRGRTPMGGGLVLVVQAHGYDIDDHIRAHGWCEDLRRALMRGDVVETRALLRGPGQHAIAPFADHRVAGALCRALGAALYVAEVHARSQADDGIPTELLAALEHTLAETRAATTASTKEADRG